MLIVRALYGLKSLGQAWRTHFAQTLESIGFKLSYADPDVWYKPVVKLNEEEYYAYLLVYVNDLLCARGWSLGALFALARDRT